MTAAQRWALKRNSAKRRVKGCRANLQSLLHCEKDALLPAEQAFIETACLELSRILLVWRSKNETSKIRYLKIKKEKA